jgi:rubredoxin
VQRSAVRKMIWVESTRSEVWACSECAWVFNPSGPPRGTSLDEMKQNFERQRDKEFASHVCAQHSRTYSPESRRRSSAG